MLFNCNNFSCLFCSCYNKFLIERFDRMNVDHFRINSVCCKLLSCFQTVTYRKSCCDDRQVFSFS